MFDKYYRGLSLAERKEFRKKTGISADTITNSYLRPDPLKRNMPRPETMIAIMKASDWTLKPLAMVEYFILDIIYTLLNEDPEYQEYLRKLEEKANKKYSKNAA